MKKLIFTSIIFYCGAVFFNIMANAYAIDALVLQGRLAEAETIFRQLQPLVARRRSPS